MRMSRIQKPVCAFGQAEVLVSADSHAKRIGRTGGQISDTAGLFRANRTGPQHSLPLRKGDLFAGHAGVFCSYMAERDDGQALSGLAEPEEGAGVPIGIATA